MQKHEPFLKRWARNKLNAKQNDESLESLPLNVAETGSSRVHDGPIKSSENESFDPLALRELFRRPEFSVRDGLDDYDGDYTAFEPRGELKTSDMRWALERAQASSSDTAESPESFATPVIADNVTDGGTKTESSS